MTRLQNAIADAGLVVFFAAAFVLAIGFGG